MSDMAWVLEGLHVDPERMLANLESTGGLFFSQKVLTALMDTGWLAATRTRRSSERRTRPGSAGCGSRSGCGRRSLTSRALSREESRRCSIQPYLANLGGVFERLEKLPVEEA